MPFTSAEAEELAYNALMKYGTLDTDAQLRFSWAYLQASLEHGDSPPVIAARVRGLDRAMNELPVANPSESV